VSPTIKASDIGSSQTLDLSGSGLPYLLVSLAGRYGCGSGGRGFNLFEPSPNGWQKIKERPATDVQMAGTGRDGWWMLTVTGRSDAEVWQHAGSHFV
jgi:hypothetical protein